ncbi:MAG TPA: PatB family C-S lyase [Candidatus Acidoferrum sp.]|jgi:cystathionine beta-lyase|nr:PatB family C-S lyase [Candidatus Acidoferrum sp.]
MERFLIGADQLRARSGGKWNTYPREVLPAFVADMDFKVAPAVQDALMKFTDTQDYGYGQMTDTIPLFEAFSKWMARRHHWQPDPALTHANATVVQGLVASLLAFSEPGDGIIAQTPIYPPFLLTIEGTGHRLVENPLVDSGTRFVVDVEGLKRAAEQASMILLCNPHNPTGRVLERAELEAIATIAANHNLTIVADEIHADLVYPGATHIPMETIAAAAERTVTLTSATKGFNIAGLRTSIAHFGSPELKARFDKRFPPHLLGMPSRVGVAASIAAWSEAEDWLNDVMLYLDHNRQRVTGWAAQANLGHYPPEATYLEWMNCRRLDLPAGTTPQQHFLEHAKVALSEGLNFGERGQGHVRLNFATSAEILEDILGRLGGALA